MAEISREDERAAQIAWAEPWAVNSKVHEQDLLYGHLMENPVFLEPSHAVKYYFDDGAKSAALLAETLAGPCGFGDDSINLLEFASGYGRVTRHLARCLPRCEVTACDIHAAAVEFVEQELGVRAIRSTSAPEDFPTDRSYDAVFALSFFSHMPSSSFGAWIDALASCVRPGGYLVFTTHGLVSQEKYFPDSKFDADGHYFATASDQGDLDGEIYGSAVTRPDYVMAQIARAADRRLKVFSEAYWWEHQDLYVVQRLPADAP